MQRRQFTRRLLSIIIPVTLQGVLSSAVNSADVFMLGYVSEEALSAVSLANQVQFISAGLFGGIASGTALMTAQYWGKKDRNAIQAVMGIGFRIALLFTAMLTLCAWLVPEAVMRLMTDSGRLISIGSSYLRIIAVSYMLESVSQVYEATLRNVGHAPASAAIGAAALAGNVVLNACFIFGIGFFPKLGVQGVALATLIARGAESALCLLHAARTRFLPWNARLIFGRHARLEKDFFRYSVPALLNELLFTLAFSSYSVILGHMGAAVVAASAVATTVRDLCTVLCNSLGEAAVAILGEQIGSGHPEEAYESGKALLWLSLLFGAMTGAFLLLIRPLVLSLFPLSEEAAGLLRYMMFISSYYVIGQTLNTTLVAGIFRAGGDTKYGMICDLVTMWFVAVPVAFSAAFLFHAPVRTVYFILCLDEYYKLPVVLVHFRKKKWMHNVTRELNGNG